MTKEELKTLKEIRKVMTMENAAFKDRKVHPDPIFPELCPESTIQEVTRVWRQSWILDPLDRLIAKYDK